MPSPVEQAQAAFQQGDWATVVRHLDPMPPSERPSHLLLLRAEARRRLGQAPATVRDDVLAGVRQAAGQRTHLRRAVRILRHLGDLASARVVGQVAVAAHPEDGEARIALAEVLGSMGREREAILTLEAGATAGGGASLWLDAGRRRLARDDHRGALRACRAVLDQQPHHAEARRLAADALLARHAYDDARAMLAPPLPPGDQLPRALAAGDLPLARQAIAELSEPLQHAWNARLHLWAGALTDARTQARRAHTVPLSALVLAACDVVDGQGDVDAMDRAVALQADAPALSGDLPAAYAWRAELHRRQSRSHDARADGHAALDAEGRYVLPYHLLILLAEHPDVPPSPTPTQPGPALADAPLPPSTYWSGPGFDAAAEARHLLGLLGANRSRWPTVTAADGQLHRAHPAPVPLHGMRPLQASVIVRDPDEVREEVRRLRAAHPEDPTMMTYGAEIDLWLGRFDDALRANEEALRRCRTQKWAWVGLGASRMFCGDADGALEAYRQGAEVTGGDGPSAYVYRGEALWRLGRPEQALPDLAEACRRKPTRIGAWLLWARVLWALGRERAAHQVLGRLRQTAPGAWIDLARHAGSQATAPELLDGMLDLMRGNRSSALPTYLSEGQVRVVTWRPPPAPSPP